MTIPGTQRILASDQFIVPNQGEIFCFRISNLSAGTYLDNFLQALNDHLPSYVFSQQTLEIHRLRIEEGLTRITPLERAREFLQKTCVGRSFDSGEFGEFLLYLFARDFIGAHKLATKIHSRGSDRTTIPGRDNTFALKDENGNVYMLVGEAKATPSVNDGLREAQSDLNDFWSSGKINYEISLASTHLRTEMTSENIDLFEAYFIDDNEAHQSLRYKNIVFVGYSSVAVQSLCESRISEEEFSAVVFSNLSNSFTNQQTLIEASQYPSIYCFLPFHSIDTARDLFARINGLER